MIVHAVLVAFYMLLFLWCLRTCSFFKLPEIRRNWVQGVFILKVFCGFLLWSIYSYYYGYRGTSDAFRYYDDAMFLYHTLDDDPAIFFKFLLGYDLDNPTLEWVHQSLRGWSSTYNYGLANDNPTVIRFNMIVALFSFGYYHVHTVFASMVSMIGLSLIFKSFYYASLRSGKWLFVAVFGAPSVLFWGSGVLKEPLLLLAIGLFVWGVIRIQNISYKYLIMIGLGLVLLVHIKPYVLLCLLPAASFYLFQKIIKFHPFISFGITHVLFFVFAVLVKYISPSYDVLYILQKKRIDFYNVAESHASGSVVQIPQIDSWTELILKIPQSFIYSYFRPFLGELSGIFCQLAAIENILILALGVFLLSKFKLFSREELPFFLFCLSFIALLAIVIGACVPVLGAVVRYKVPALPFLLTVFMMLSKRTFRK